MQRYRQLEELGVKREDCYQNWMEDGEKEDPRYEEWLKTKEEYGIDPRSTWNWSDEFMDYMYIHLEMFNRINIVDFEAETVIFDGTPCSVQSAIDTILKWMQEKYYPSREDKLMLSDYENYDEFKKVAQEYLDEKHRILLLFATIIDHLNW